MVKRFYFSDDAISLKCCLCSEKCCVSVWNEPRYVAKKPNERSCTDQKKNGRKWTTAFLSSDFKTLLAIPV